MKMRRSLITLSLISAFCLTAEAQRYKDAYLDNVHPMTVRGITFGRGDSTWVYIDKDSVLINVKKVNRYKQDSVSRFFGPMWVGPHAGTQPQSLAGGFMAHVSGQANINDSVRFVPGNWITMSQSGHAITIGTSIDSILKRISDSLKTTIRSGSRILNLWIDTIDTYAVKWHNATSGQSYQASVNDSGYWALKRVLTADSSPYPPDSSFGLGPVFERFYTPADDYADTSNWFYGDFFWHDCSRVKIRLAGGYQLNSSTWPIGDFSWAEVQFQVLDKVSSTWQNTGYWYVQNQTTLPVQGILPEYLPMRSYSPPTTYMFEFFEPAQYGYTMGDLTNGKVRYRSRGFSHNHHDPRFPAMFMAFGTGIFAWHCSWTQDPVTPEGYGQQVTVKGGTLNADAATVKGSLNIGEGANAIVINENNVGSGMVRAPTVWGTTEMATPRLYLTADSGRGEIVYATSVLIDSANNIWARANDSRIVTDNLIPRDFHYPDTSRYDHGTDATLITRQEFETRMGYANGGFTFDTLHTTNLYLKNPAGIDTVKIQTDTTGDAIFYYRESWRYDSVIVKNNSFLVLGDIFGEHGNMPQTVGSPVSTVIMPPDPNVVLRCHVNLHIPAGTFYEIKLFAYIPNMLAGDSGWTPIGFLTGSYGDGVKDLNMGFYPYNIYKHGTPGYQATPYVFGMVPNQPMKFKIWGIFWGGDWYGSWVGGAAYVSPPTYVVQYLTGAPYMWTDTSATPVRNTYEVWCVGQEYLFPAQWIESGRFSKDSLNVTYLNASDRIKTPVVEAQTISADHTVGIGHVSSDTVKGTLTLVTPNGKSAMLTGINTRHRLFELPDTSAHEHDSVAVLVTEERFQSFLGGIKSYITAPADKPPNSENALDDEFNGTAVDTTVKWKWRDRGTKCTLTEAHGLVFLTDTATAGNHLRILEQTITDTAFTIKAKMTGANSYANYSLSGLEVLNTSTGYMYAFGIEGSTSGCRVIVTLYNSPTSYNYTYYGSAYEIAGLYSQYFQIEKTNGAATSSAKYLNFYVSSDGMNWGKVYGIPSLSYIETAGNKIDRVGFFVDAELPSGTAFPATTALWFWRYNWVPDYDPSVDY